MKSLILIGLSILSLSSTTFPRLQEFVVKQAIEKVPAQMNLDIELSSSEIDTIYSIVKNHSDKQTISEIKDLADADLDTIVDYAKSELTESEQSSLTSIYENHFK